jgi:pyridoxine 4-dehydrogenase
MKETPGPDFLPLSAEQERCYTERVLQRRRDCIVVRLSIDGSLDTRRLLKAIRIVAARRPALRAMLTFTPGGEPAQVVSDLADGPLVVGQAVVGSSSSQFDAYTRAIVKRALSSRWNIVRELPYKLYLLRRSDDQHVLLCIFDCIFFDQRSVAIFERDMWQVYGDLSRDDAGPRGGAAQPDLPVDGQRIHTCGASSEDARYWSGRYAVAPPMWQPAHAGRPQAQALGPRAAPHPRGAELAERLRSARTATGYTPAELCTAAFASLAFSLTGQDRLAIDVPVDSRTAGELTTMGAFTSVRALVLDRAGGDRAALLNQVRRQMSDAVAHAHLGGDTELGLRRRQLARWHSHPRGSLGVAYLKTEESDLSVPAALNVIRESLSPPFAVVGPASLAFVALDHAAGLEATFLYAEDAVDRDTASALPALFDRELLRIAQVTDRADGTEAADRAAEVAANADSRPAQAACLAAGQPGRATLRPGLSALRDEERAVCLHVDLAEVRAALLRHPLVTTADAWVRDGRTGGSSVVASVTTRGEVADEELREHCRNWSGATQYMIPPGTIYRTAVTEPAGATPCGEHPDRGVPVPSAGGAPPFGRLGFGTMRLTGPGAWGEPPDRREVINLLRRAVELGVEFIDTADSYGPFVSEEIIAEALYPYRGVTVATKGGLVRTGPDKWYPVGRPEYLRQCVEMSLRRLRQETIELYHLHRIDPAVPLADQLGALDELRREGKIARIGLSEVTVPEIAEARLITAVSSVQNRYNILDRQSEEVLDYCQREGLTFIPWFPVRAGLLEGPDGTAEADAALAAVASRTGASPVQVALAWLLRRSPVMLPIPGTTSASHLAENLAAAALDLTDEQFESLSALRPESARAVTG